MHIDQLSLTNFICFDDTETTFVGPLDRPVDDLIPRLTRRGGSRPAALSIKGI